MDKDIRYEFVTCACCGNSYQLIDFGGNPHAWRCPDAYPLASDLDRLKGEYPNARFFPPAKRGD